jgi:hypothetical protein
MFCVNSRGKEIDIRASFILAKWAREDWYKEGIKKGTNTRYEGHENKEKEPDQSSPQHSILSLKGPS